MMPSRYPSQNGPPSAMATRRRWKEFTGASSKVVVIEVPLVRDCVHFAGGRAPRKVARCPVLGPRLDTTSRVRRGPFRIRFPRVTNVRMRTALVTGANRGLGSAIARSLRERGIRVWLGARDPSGLGPMGVELDVRDPGAAVERVLASDGRIDILVNNAGITDY